jgi:hypothetical protein
VKENKKKGAEMLIVIQQLMRSRLLIIRSLERLISLDTFKVLYDSASKDEQEIVQKLIEEYDKDGVDRWLNQQRRKSPDSMNMIELRQLARKLGIRDYHILSKASLLSEIHGVKNGRVVA